MPSQTRVRALISDVEQGLFMEALREFYHEETAMQENSDPPRDGLRACLEHEARFLDMVGTFHHIQGAAFLVDGNRAAIRWVFEATLIGGERISRDEMALQRWEGEKILCEQFFYDTAATAKPADRPTAATETSEIACVAVGEHGEVVLPTSFFSAQTFQPGDRLIVTGSPAGLGLKQCDEDRVQ